MAEDRPEVPDMLLPKYPYKIPSQCGETYAAVMRCWKDKGLVACIPDYRAFNECLAQYDPAMSPQGTEGQIEKYLKEQWPVWREQIKQHWADVWSKLS